MAFLYVQSSNLFRRVKVERCVWGEGCVCPVVLVSVNGGTLSLPFHRCLGNWSVVWGLLRLWD